MIAAATGASSPRISTVGKTGAGARSNLQLYWLEYAIYVLILLLGWRAFLFFLTSSSGSGTDSDSLLSKLVWLTIYGFVVISIAIKPISFFKRAAVSPWPIVFATIAATSTIWSINPPQTLLRSIGLLFCTFIGIMLAVRFTPKEVFRLLTWTAGILAIASLVFALLLPELGKDAHGDWIGVFNHKNRLGIAIGVSALVWGTRLRLRVGSALTNVGMTGLCMGLLVMADAKTSMVAVLLASLLILSLPIWRRINMGLAGLLLIVASVVAPVLGLLVWTNLPFVTGALGRDVTLTGRTYVWDTVIQSIDQRPILGFGYEAFWGRTDGTPGQISLLMGGDWIPYSAHNGYLDTLLAVGILGFMVFAIGFSVLALLRFALLRKRESPMNLFGVAILGFLVFFSLLESGVTEYNSTVWILITYLSSSALVPSGELEQYMD